MAKTKVKKLELIGTMIGAWMLVVIVAYPVAWFVSGVTVSGRCSVPTPDIVVKCAHAQIRAGQIQTGIMGVAGLAGLWFALVAAQESLKTQSRK